MTEDTAPATDEEWRAKWESAARRAFYRWRWFDRCEKCGEPIGHFGGSVDRDPCPLIPLNVPLDELRPNCYEVRRIYIGDAIRKHCKS